MSPVLWRIRVDPMRPGATALQRMPSRPHWVATIRVIAMIAAFEAA